MTDDSDQALDTHWPAYYAVTAERPSWITTRTAADAFGPPPVGRPWFAVDLGCGAGRDSRELLRRGWQVLATDMTPEGPETLWRLTPSEDRERLETSVCRLADFEIPACDLVNANLILPFQPVDEYEATWSGSSRPSRWVGASAACSSAIVTSPRARRA